MIKSSNETNVIEDVSLNDFRQLKGKRHSFEKKNSMEVSALPISKGCKLFLRPKKTASGFFKEHKSCIAWETTSEQLVPFKKVPFGVFNDFRALFVKGRLARAVLGTTLARGAELDEEFC